MELELNDLIISEEQAYSFAVNICNDIIKYFKELEENFNELCKKAIVVLNSSILIRDNIYQYKLCNYSRIA